MSKKLFDKSLPPKCEYCVLGIKTDYNDEILCKKRGVTDKTDSCRHFKYDPLKREPKKEIISTNYSPEDFIL